MGKRGFGRAKPRRLPGKKWPIAILLGALAAVVVSRGRSVISAAPKKSKAAVQEISTDVKTMFGKDADPEQPKPKEPAADAPAAEAMTEKQPAAAEEPVTEQDVVAETTPAAVEPTAPHTTEAGEDASGTFRPTKVEPDDFGVVVTDTEPAGLDANTKGWVKGDGSGACPEAFPIKGNANSRIYHRPGEASYEQTIPEICFADEESAGKLGYRPRKG